MGTAQTRIASTPHINENYKLKLRKDQEKITMKPKEELQTVHLSTRFGHKNDFHMYAGRIPI